MIRIEDGRRCFYQWDTGRRIVIDINDNDITQVHYSYDSSTPAVVVDIETESGKKIADVPDYILKRHGLLKVYVYGANHTQYTTQFEVRERAKPGDVTDSKEERKIWDALKEDIDEINDAVDEVKVQSESNKNNISTLDTNLSALSDNFNDFSSETESDIDNINEVASQHEKRISNLEELLIQEAVLVDDEAKVVKSVPENVCQYASVDMVGGLTRKCTNIFGGEALADKIVGMMANSEKDTEARTVSFYAPFASSKILFTNFKPNTAYTFVLYGACTHSAMNNLTVVYTDDSYERLHFEKSKELSYCIFTSSNTKSLSRFSGVNMGGTTTLYYDKCGIFEGELTIEDFEPYFEGLQSAKVTDVQSIGQNLLPMMDTQTSIYGFTCTPKSDGSYVLSGSRKEGITGPIIFRWSFPTPLPISTYTTSLNNPATIDVAEEGEQKGSYVNTVLVWFTGELSGKYTAGCYGTRTNNICTFKSDWPITTAIIRIGDNIQSLDNFIIKPVLNYGDVAKEYVPHTEEILEIPQAVRDIEGYGWGINETVYNYIDFEKKQFVKRVDCVDLGTLNFANNAIGGYQTTISSGKIGMKVLCSKYHFGTNTFAWERFDTIPDKTINTVYTHSNIYIKDTDLTNAEAFKSAMSGVKLYYELAEPEITDISNLLPDNFLPVESGGIISLIDANNYCYNTPNTITYLKKEE